MKTTATALITFVLLATITASAQDSETKVRMKNLPAPVQQTVNEQSKGAVIRGFAKEVKDGQTFYEVELKVAGHKKDVLIDPAGKVVEVEEEVTLDSLPPVVKAEILKQAGKRRIVMVESITKDNAVVAYEAHVKKLLKTSEIKVGLDGKLITQ
ncbi:MAG: hypothetical protein M3X11_11745, partial [Acidobacteriota bacterium]|nr:hypothetical protein [Acidobacteriota bacterium]